MDNMRIYEASRAVPADAQKPFNNGRFSGTDIKPMWRIRKLTELFGPAGIGWYTEVLSERSEQIDDSTMIAVVDLNLYIKDGDGWSRPIYGTGGNVLLSKGRVSDEGYKMAYTDALSVACKALGIGADIYYGADSSSKHAASYADAPGRRAEPASAAQRPNAMRAEGASAAKQDAPETRSATRSGAAYERPNAMRAEPASAAKQDAGETRDAKRRGATGRITAAQVGRIKMMCTPEEIGKLCEKYSVSEITDLGELTAAAILKKLEVRNGVPAQGDAG